MAALLALFAGAPAAAGASAEARAAGHPVRAAIIARTEAALVDQMRCRKPPQVAETINGMLKNGLIRYVEDQNGSYRFRPTVPMTFLGLRITDIAGFDYTGFDGTPGSQMLGPAPPEYLEIGIAAPVDELRRRARRAGLVEDDKRPGLKIASGNEVLAGMRGAPASSIECGDI
jgi:hypothetical protein